MENTYSFYATLTANIFLNDNDFYFLCDCCKNHYDFTVRMSNEIGGFLHGFKVRRTPIKGLDITNDDRIVEFNYMKLGLIMKALEIQTSEQALRLNLLFNKVASEMFISQQSINKNIIGLTNI